MIEPRFHRAARLPCISFANVHRVGASRVYYCFSSQFDLRRLKHHQQQMETEIKKMQEECSEDIMKVWRPDLLTVLVPLSVA